MYGDNYPSFSIEALLLDRTKELGSLSRALPGLSLSSGAFSQWPVKAAPRRGAAHCQRERRQQAPGQALLGQPRGQPPDHARAGQVRGHSTSYVPYAPYSPPASPSCEPFSPVEALPAPSPPLHYDSLAPGSLPQLRADPGAWPAPTLPHPRPVCTHAAHADLGWCSWDRPFEPAVDAARSESLTTASTLSDSAAEPADDYSTVVCAHVGPCAAPAGRPPRPCLQPAKTGFALWVGNLAAHTSLLDLRELFGTPEIQSIYLIQRTGCAFVNYSSGPALDAAIALFHRRSGRLNDHDLVIKAQRADDEQYCAQAASPPIDSPDRFFICKSLTVEDLESAKQSGLWSTQLRNRDKFNAALQQAENVYLVFSANRTSAFYGFARLETPFGDDPTPPTTANPAHDDASGFDIQRTPPIYCTETGACIPAGEIVLDPLRGSQFWKVDGCPYAECDTERWAAPARITWLSSPNTSVSFSRTRQLKNSLNQNKPVKVARDGTEIDPAVGRELCDMFA